MICDLCLSGRHARCRGRRGECDCGMCRLKRERKEKAAAEHRVAFDLHPHEESP